MKAVFEFLMNDLARVHPIKRLGRVERVANGIVAVKTLEDVVKVGDCVKIGRTDDLGEVIAVSASGLDAYFGATATGIGVGTEVELVGQVEIAPDVSWLGRIMDPFGRPLDGRPLPRGCVPRAAAGAPPPAAARKGLGDRLATGSACFDTLLPLVRGQRIGLFAGSGVGKSTLLGRLAQNVSSDVVVIALVGERGRELRDFVSTVLGPEGLKRCVVVAATSDQSALLRRQCIHTAMAVAESFRDEGQHVLFLADSVTRYAEAHREIALSAGEEASLRGHPPSVQSALMALAERAGPGTAAQGDITAVFSVLVAGSDMEEPIADILRGVLDGHVVLDRKIAERGRFPAVDLLRSVSRCLPEAATAAENQLIAKTRRLLGAWENAELMIQAGLYQAGTDPLLDEAIQLWPALDSFLSAPAPGGEIAQSFEMLEKILNRGQNRGGLAC